MNGERELDALGVTAVDQATIEARVLAQAQQAGAAPTEAPTDATDPSSLLQQLAAVRREARTVAAAVDRFQQQAEEREQQAAQAGADGDSQAPEDGQAPGPAGAAPGGALQQALMQQRLAGLQAQQQQLEAALQELGVVSAGATAGGSADGEPASTDAAAAASGSRSRAPMRGKRQAAAPPPPAGPAAGNGKQKSKKQVQFDLAEADVFEGADAAGGAAAAAAAGGLVETERDRLIRLGILTPFDRLDGFERRIERGPRQAGGGGSDTAAAAAAGGLEGHESIRRVGEKMRAAQAARPTTMLVDASELPRPERPSRRIDEGFWRQSSSGRSALPGKKKRKRTLAPAKRHRLAPGVRHARGGGSGSEGEEWSGSEGGSGSGSEDEAAGSGEDLAGEFDDADAAVFEERRASYLRRQGRKAARRRRLRKAGGGGAGEQQQEQQAAAGGQPGELEDEVEADGEAGGAAGQPRGGGPPAGSDLRSGRERQDGSGLESDLESDYGSEDEEEEEEDVVFEGGYRLPADVWNRLFDYQRTAVKWMWELHTQRAGGIIGDEMGLGKTIQVISFLAGLHHSGLFRPSLIVCPATVLRQWLRELRAWWPLFRVALLHDSARSGSAAGARPSRFRLIQEIARSDCGILLTTYETMRLQRAELVGVDWGYVVLDEGHKIRNPDAEVTLAAKQMQTVHRIVMSGSPIQNRLTELWSLFDFVFPGKLGTLPVFTAQFALPIQIGGYANANPLQVSTAYKCAVILRDLIAPYLLRRRKVDVRAQLPQKTEQVLFCTLTGEQRTLYKGYLSSKELQEIFAGSRTALAGIDILRKICNHPDLLERAKWEAAQDYGNPERSGKMQVLAKVLRHWREQGHKALVFTQTQQMLDIVEKHAQAQGYTYHRMDGSTSVATRARLIDDFNNNPEVFCFLLTTRVGGLGVNLTGANRVLLYDPDWNPSTDVQARERAWRIGQTREVVIYRLITSGTIEEKVYHRQVYKHFLTDKVLRDPRQRRFFKAKDLTDLFTLGDEYADSTETASLFATLGTDVLPDVEEAEAAAAEGDGEEQHASDRDDYSSGPQGSPQQAQQGQQGRRRPSSRSSSRSRRSSSADRGSGGDLPASAGVRSEAVAQEEEGGEAANGSGKGDAKILRELFEGSGVRGAIDHTKVEGANDPQRRAAEQEAARIAKRAAEALRQSRLACQQAPVNQPTWTGRSGGAGLPGAGGGQPRFGRATNPRLGPAAQVEQAAAAAVAAGGSSGTGRRFGAGARPPLAGAGAGIGAGAGAANGAAPRSSEIIARLRERQAAVASAAAAAAAADPAVEEAQLLAAQVASFLEACGGAAASDELVQHFQSTVGAAQLPVFRGVLKQVAALQRRPGGGKQWVLRPDYAGGGQG
ncbi:CHROMATIN REMODELING 8 [Chlorella sorokiniana]|uniref:CHROMATIN REMODELING 8 n=1 Tax=Chlorella sorokiniana TaxID=3076 RepID=A0A2P6TSS2_CHLSO|nr:CHROMATIN REMODELING 8 [Chlorella sorokiniana]|eukprot:PRW57121.1 CHROMATIN REMODELING 8 [Chlorella sorokiniana]